MSKREKSIISAAAGLWKNMKETGMTYERKVRAQWQKRLKRERHSQK